MYSIPIFVYDPLGEDTKHGLPGWEDTLILPDGYEYYIDMYVEQAQLHQAQQQGFDFYPDIATPKYMINNKREIPLFTGRHN